MCYSPLEIRNNAKSGHKNIRLTKFVPCGSCEECYANYQKEWFLRAYYQYKETVDVFHGKVAFVTLTYNDHCLPMYHDSSANFHCKCFNKHDIQLFVKYMRRYATTYLHKDVDTANNIKSIFCSEFGPDKRGTHRPHYHGLIYLPFDISEYRLKKMLKFSWSRCRKEDKGKRFKDQIHYPLGYVSFSKGKGAFVNSPAALNYCMKYTSKNMNGYTDWYGLQDYINQSESNYEKIKDYLPFHLQSRGFGIYGVGYITDDHILKGYVDHPCPPADHPDIHFTLPIPDYYLRHINYIPPKLENNYKIGMLQHSPRFYKLLDKQIANSLNRTEKTLKDVLSSYDDFKTRFSHCVGSLFEGNNLQQIYNIIHSITHNRLKDYALYKSLNRYSTNHVSSDSDLRACLNDFVKRTAIEHDYLVNYVDLSETDFEIKDEIVPYQRTQIIPLRNPLMSYEELEDKPFFDALPNEDIYANRVIYLKCPVQEVHFVQERRLISKYTASGKPIIHAKRGSYLDKNKHIKEDIAYCRPWSDFPQFRGFDVVDELITELNNKNKNHHLFNKRTKWLDEKQAKDYYNSSIY